MEPTIRTVTKEQFDQACATHQHTYFFGNLAKPQEQFACHPGPFELGMGSYPQFTFEAPHVHAANQEFNYVLEGAVKVVNLETGQEHMFKPGDLFSYDPGVRHLSKNLPGTRVLFFKSPGGNDKELLPLSPAIEAWGSSWDAPWDGSRA
ncbi:MAG: cupin domain-containing protein [Coriobacteriia bacterium]|nr:cupin domain-containing protein [Coriobacteriia bacterium]